MLTEVFCRVHWSAWLGLADVNAPSGRWWLVLITVLVVAGMAACVWWKAWDAGETLKAEGHRSRFGTYQPVGDGVVPSEVPDLESAISDFRKQRADPRRTAEKEKCQHRRQVICDWDGVHVKTCADCHAVCGYMVHHDRPLGVPFHSVDMTIPPPPGGVPL